MKPQELVDKMNKEFPHFKMRLGTSEDPEVSSVFINFFPKGVRPKTDTPPDKSGQNDPDEHEKGSSQPE